MNITSRHIYCFLIVESLKEFNGKEETSEVINRVLEKSKSQLTSDDWAKLSSTMENRCINHIRFARQTLVDVGVLSNAQHGVWELTKKGIKLIELINRMNPLPSYKERGEWLIKLAKINFPR